MVNSKSMHMKYASTGGEEKCSSTVNCAWEKEERQEAYQILPRNVIFILASNIQIHAKEQIFGRGCFLRKVYIKGC